MRFLELWYLEETEMCLCSSVLVAAGMGFIFFLVAGTVLGFGFRMRVALVTH